jgi:HSP20 family molecular chaperone IbpA
MTSEYRPIRVGVGRLPEEDAPGPSTAGAGSNVPRRDVVTPLIDIHETPDGLVLEADLPGASEDSVSVQLEDNVLSLHAQVVPSAPADTRLIHEESRVAEFQRSFILSDEVDRARIAAELKNGVLRLTLPKAERARARRIEIKSPS